MSESKAQWPPQVGDHVQIVATGAPGMVMDGGKSPNFLVALYSYELRGVTTAPYRTYTLRELGPGWVPAPVASPVLPAARRRAKEAPAAD